MLRRTIFVAYCLAVIVGTTALSAGGTPSRAVADPWIGTWPVKPASGTPWADGGSLAVRASTASEVKALVPDAVNGQARIQCVGGYQPTDPFPNPSVNAWYVATFSWQSPTMGGCTSNKTFGSISLFGLPSGFVGFINPVRPDGTIHGCWSADNATGCKFFDSVPETTGTEKTISEPSPGGTTTVTSPAFPPGGVDCGGSPGKADSGAAGQRCTVTATGAGGDLEGTVVVTEGEASRQAGTLFLVCWVFYDFRNDQGEVIEVTPGTRLRLCLAMAKAFYVHHKLGRSSAASTLRAPAAAGRLAAEGCRTQRIAIALRTHKGRIVSARRAKSRRLTARSVRYTCSASAGTATVTLTGPSKGNLRTALGRTLDLRVYRSKKAPRRSAKLTFRFGW